MTTKTADPILPPATHEDDGDGGGEWVLLTVARDQVIAHLIRGRLASEGIESIFDRSNPAPGAWMHPFGDPQAPVKVLVRRRNLEWARFSLEEVGHRAPDPDAPGPPALRWMVVATAVVVALLLLLEIWDFAPCVIGIFCI
jgi:hypothetical protein